MSHFSEAPMRAVGWWPFYALLVSFIFLPVYGPYIGTTDGAIWPVTSRVELFGITPTQDGRIEFRFSYKKLRFCEFAGVRLDIAGETVGFAPSGTSGPPLTRPTGEQMSRVFVADTPTLDDAAMWFFHRCSPAWLTVTKVLG